MKTQDQTPYREMIHAVTPLMNVAGNYYTLTTNIMFEGKMLSVNMTKLNSLLRIDATWGDENISEGMQVHFAEWFREVVK